jgi:hypothetical protein
MTRPKDPSTKLRLRAEVLRQTLPDLCRKEGRSKTSALRVASHLVRDEANGQPPKQCTAAIERAKQICRLEYEAADLEYMAARNNRAGSVPQIVPEEERHE